MKKINQKYDEIERMLIEDFVNAQVIDDRDKMKQISKHRELMFMFIRCRLKRVSCVLYILFASRMNSFSRFKV